MSSGVPVRRRAVLAGSASVVAGFAGCSFMADEEPTPSAIRLSKVTVESKDDNPHVVEVLVQRDTELLLWEEFRLQAAGENEIVTQCVQKRPWEDPGQYFIRSRLDDRSSWIELDTIARAREHAYREEGYMNVDILVTESGDYHFQTHNENFDCDMNHEGAD